jgi:GNAT superfamily N-acetyltransferase
VSFEIDGHQLVAVPMRAEMGPALVAFHETLSPATTRNRFFTLHPHLSPQEVEWFCGVDHVDREALVVLDGDDIVAVARFDRLAPGSTHAEAAFVVTDTWQHRGLGGWLLRLLAERARQLGVTQLVADTLASNRAMQAVFRHCGLPCRASFDGGVVHVTIEVPTPGATAPSATADRAPLAR